jgi:cbb3-type cytochrome oxidase subunit 3
MTSDTITINKKDLIKKLSHPTWAIATIVLAILLIATYFYSPTAKSISEDEAKQLIIDFVSEQGATATIVSIEKEGELFLIVIEVEGEQVPVYLTKDGKNLIPSVIPLLP